MLWIRVESVDYQAQFVCNLSLGYAEDILTTGIQDVSWSGLPNGQTYTLTVIPAFSPDQAVEGYSPRIELEDDGKFYWYCYSSTLGEFVNTGVLAQGSYSSDALGVSQAEFNSYQSEIAADLTTINNTFNTYNTRITNLEDKRLTITGTKDGDSFSVTEDENSEIDLGEIGGGSGSSSTDNLIMLENEQTIDGTLYPRGTTLAVSPDGDIEVKGTDSLYHYNIDCNWSATSGYVKVASLVDSTILTLHSRIYNSPADGTIYIQKQGYGYKAVSTDEQLATRVKLYKSGYNWYLCLATSPSTDPYLYHYNITSTSYLGMYQGAEITSDPEYSATYLYSIPHFITDSEFMDYVTIMASSYSADDLSITKYNVTTDTIAFNITETLSQPITLTFNALHDTIITVSDGTTTSESPVVGVGHIATFFYTSSTEYTWTISESTTGGSYVKSVSVNDGESVFPDAVTGNVNLTIQSTGGFNYYNAKVRYVGIQSHAWSFTASNDAIFTCRRAQPSTSCNTPVTYYATSQGFYQIGTNYRSEVNIYQDATDKYKAWYQYGGGSTTSPDNQGVIFTVICGSLSFTDKNGTLHAISQSTDNDVIDMNNDINSFNSSSKCLLSGLSYTTDNGSTNQTFDVNSYSLLTLPNSRNKVVTITNPLLEQLNYYRLIQIKNSSESDTITVKLVSVDGFDFGTVDVLPGSYHNLKLAWFGMRDNTTTTLWGRGWFIDGIGSGSGSGSGSEVSFDDSNQTLYIDGDAHTITGQEPDSFVKAVRAGSGITSDETSYSSRQETISVQNKTSTGSVTTSQRVIFLEDDSEQTAIGAVDAITASESEYPAYYYIPSVQLMREYLSENLASDSDVEAMIEDIFG